MHTQPHIRQSIWKRGVKYELSRFSSQSSLQAFKRYICIYKEQKEHPIEEYNFQNKPA